MNKKLIKLGLMTALVGSSLSASNYNIVDTFKNIELPEIGFLKKEDILKTKENNLKEIAYLHKQINKLEDENLEIDKAIKKNPKLYEKKKLFEETKNDYFYRIKLNGKKPNNINFTIEKNYIYVDLELKEEKKEKNSYYFNSSSIKQSFSIPKNVNQEKIKYFIDGDYFTLKLPKK